MIRGKGFKADKAYSKALTTFTYQNQLRWAGAISSEVAEGLFVSTAQQLANATTKNVFWTSVRYGLSTGVTMGGNYCEKNTRGD